MRDFKFRLDRIQRLATRNKRQAATGLSAARRMLEARQTALVQLEAERSRRGRAAPSAGTRVANHVLRTQQSHLLRLGAEARYAELQMEREARNVERLRQAFVAAKREERKFELLRQRRYDVWEMTNRRREQRELDEIAGHSSQSKNSDSGG